MATSPDELDITVEPTVPRPGDLAIVDVVSVTFASGETKKWPGTCYRSAIPKERPTHYPEVLNGLGQRGYVVNPKGVPFPWEKITSAKETIFQIKNGPRIFIPRE